MQSNLKVPSDVKEKVIDSLYPGWQWGCPVLVKSDYRGSKEIRRLRRKLNKRKVDNGCRFSK